MTNGNKTLWITIVLLILSLIAVSYTLLEYKRSYDSLIEESEKKTMDILKATERNDSMMIVLESLENKIDSMILSKEESYENKRDSIGSLPDDSAVVWFERYIKSWRPRFGEDRGE